MSKKKQKPKQNKLAKEVQEEAAPGPEYTHSYFVSFHYSFTTINKSGFHSANIKIQKEIETFEEIKSIQGFLAQKNIEASEIPKVTVISYQKLKG